MLPLEIEPHRRDQFRDSAGRGVVGLEAVKRLGGGIKDRFRRMEVRLADIQPQDLLSRRFELPGFGAHHHRRYQRLLGPVSLNPLPLGEDRAQDL